MLSWYNPFYLLNETASWMFTQAEYKGQVDIEEWMKKYIMINNQKHRMELELLLCVTQMV